MMTLIEDLGMRVPKSNPNGQKARWGVHECSVCLNRFEINTASAIKHPNMLCKACALKHRGYTERLKTASTFKANIDAIHSGRIEVIGEYTYSNVKLECKCNVCGVVFMGIPEQLTAGQGCRACALDSYGAEARRTFVEDVNRIHDGTITCLGGYVRSYLPVPVSCNICGYSWEASPHSLKKGHGCPDCAAIASSFKDRPYTSVPTIIYYVYFPEFNLWKIGCTSKTVVSRFSNDKTEMWEIHQELFQFGGDAYKLEGYLLRQFKEFKYRGPKILKAGNTELLTQEVNFKEALEQAKVELGITNGS